MGQQSGQTVTFGRLTSGRIVRLLVPTEHRKVTTLIVGQDQDARLVEHVEVERGWEIGLRQDALGLWDLVWMPAETIVEWWLEVQAAPQDPTLQEAEGICLAA